MLISTAQTMGPRWGLEPMALSWLFVPALVIPSMLLVSLIKPDPKVIANNLEQYYPGYHAPPRTAAQHAADQVAGIGTWLRYYPMRTTYVAGALTQGLMTMMMALTPLHLVKHGADIAAVSLCVSIHVIGMFGFSLPLGRLTDRFGRKFIMLVGLLISAGGSVLVPTTEEYWITTLGLFLVGVGWGCVNVSGSALIADSVSPAVRGRAVGTGDTVQGAMAIALPILGGLIVAKFGLESLAPMAVLLAIVPVVMVLRLRELSPGKFATED